MTTDPVGKLNEVLTDRYHIERELGEGGMATVYLARDLKHERQVAIKVLRPDLTAVVGAERFLAEIRTTANLQHPHILPLFDSGEAGGFLWYAMPYVEGETLRGRIDREKQLPVAEAVGIVAKVLAALGVAHDRGIIHRDVKPANILIDPRGEPLIADFGIALAVQEAGGGRLTETGLSLGTPYYMSPEQATGDRDPDARSDLYSVGCMLYEMLTGEPPHGGATAQAIVGRILTADPTPPTEARPSIPPNVEGAVLTALEKTPADRFASAADFTAALGDDGYRHGPAEGGAAAQPRHADGWRVAAVTLGALCTVLVAVLLWPTDAPPETESLWVRVALGADAYTGVFGRMSLSPDGRRLVYVESDGERQVLRVRELSDPEGRPLPGTEGAITPGFSPEGDRVAFVSSSGAARALKVVSLEGGPAVTLTDDRVDAGGVRWGDDGYIYYDTGFDVDGFSRIREDGSGGPELLTEPPEGNWHTPQDVLPGGRGVLYSNQEPRHIGVLDLETMETRALVEGVGARYAHSGHLLWGDASSTLFAAPFDLETLELTGPPVPITGDVRILTQLDLTLSETGVMLHGIGSSVDPPVLQFVDGTGEAMDGERRWPGLALDVAGAPAGDRLVARVQSPEIDDERDLWLSDDDGGAPTRITFTGDVGAPVFTPDGSSVLFPRYADGGDPHLGLFRLRLDPLGTPEQVLADPVVLPRIVDGGQGPRLVATAEGGGTIQGTRAVRSWPVDGAGRPTGDPDTLFVQDNYTGDAAVSPGGRWLTFTHFEGGFPQVKVKPWPGPSEAEWTLSGTAGGMPLWSADGSYLTWVDPGAQTLHRIPVLEGISFRTGEPSSVPAPRGLVWVPVSQQITSGFTADARPVLVRPERDQPGLMLVTGLHRILEERVPE